MRKGFLLLSVILVSGCNTLDRPKPPVPMPPTDVPVAVGAVAPVALLINELKCDYNEWLDARVPYPDRLVIGKVTGTLTLSLTRDFNTSAGLGVAVAAGPINITPSASQTTETKVENGLVIPFEMSPNADGTKPSGTKADCQPENRLASPILGLKALGTQLSSAPSGSPYFRLSDDLHYTGQFYLKQDTELKAKVVILAFTIDPGSLGRNAEFIQKFDIKVNVTGSAPALTQTKPATAKTSKVKSKKKGGSGWFGKKVDPRTAPNLGSTPFLPPSVPDPTKNQVLPPPPPLPSIIQFNDDGSIATP